MSTRTIKVLLGLRVPSAPSGMALETWLLLLQAFSTLEEVERPKGTQTILVERLPYLWDQMVKVINVVFLIWSESL